MEVPRSRSWALPVIAAGTCPFIQNVTAARMVRSESESDTSIGDESSPTVREHSHRRQCDRKSSSRMIADERYIFAQSQSASGVQVGRGDRNSHACRSGMRSRSPASSESNRLRVRDGDLVAARQRHARIAPRMRAHKMQSSW